MNVYKNDPYKKSTFPFSNRLRRFIWIISWKLLGKWTPIPFHNWRVFLVRLFGAKIGLANAIYPDCKIWAPWLLETGDVVTIGPGVEVYNPGGVRLGHHTVLSQNSYLCGATHNYNDINFAYLKRRIVTEPYVWICARAVVLPGVVCREGSILGVSSVISKDMEAWTVYSGHPAIKIKKRKNFLEAPVPLPDKTDILDKDLIP
ncbi:putative colanic acid biosynthesis acetyltransferase [Chitinophaga silvatica]|uniref:Putative colanic acid biosynthesis acetyltransferase n=1 Tax=Chitinophaga silvatica TaxID=2282649 RepID=A0A3E1YHY1_9BACT|nr:putative colanic acid biosynthesis acetyltransferase [Chitinophaga silvatica]RFS26992.1 putative colanic acid biosynthesis acetyltransferase [Chitinophaga silvatica]